MEWFCCDCCYWHSCDLRLIPLVTGDYRGGDAPFVRWFVLLCLFLLMPAITLTMEYCCCSVIVDCSIFHYPWWEFFCSIVGIVVLFWPDILIHHWNSVGNGPIYYSPFVGIVPLRCLGYHCSIQWYLWCTMMVEILLKFDAGVEWPLDTDSPMLLEMVIICWYTVTFCSRCLLIADLMELCVWWADLFLFGYLPHRWLSWFLTFCVTISVMDIWKFVVNDIAVVWSLWCPTGRCCYLWTAVDLVIYVFSIVIYSLVPGVLFPTICWWLWAILIIWYLFDYIVGDYLIYTGLVVMKFIRYILQIHSIIYSILYYITVVFSIVLLLFCCWWVDGDLIVICLRYTISFYT